MAIESALIRLFGAGVTALGAAVVGCSPPSRLIDPQEADASEGFLHYLVDQGLMQATRSEILAFTTDIKNDLGAGRLSPEAVEVAGDVVTELLLTCPIEAGVIRGIHGLARADAELQQAGAALDGLVNQLIAHGLATGLLGPADAATNPGQLAEIDCRRLLVLLTSNLFADDALIDTLGPAFEKFLDSVAPIEPVEILSPAVPTPIGLQPAAPPPAPVLAPALPSLATAGPVEAVAMPAAEPASEDEVQRLSSEHNLTVAALEGLLAAFARHRLPTDLKERMLAEKAGDLAELCTWLQRTQHADPAIAELRRRAAQALRDGELDLADSLLSEAEGRDLTSLEPGEEAQIRRARAAAESRAARGWLAELRLDYRLAAEHFEAAAGGLQLDDAERRWTYVIRQGVALQKEAEEFGDMEALEAGIIVFARALDLRPRSEAPDQWAVTQNNLGNALLALGEREQAADKLDLAAKSYRLALEVRTAERAPEEWALLQTNLGSALLRQGEIARAPDLFRDAVTAFRLALRHLDPDATPLDWAMTEINLGAALSNLSAFSDDTETLEEAARAFRAVLDAGAPGLDRTHQTRLANSYGNVLLELGERTDEPRWLEEAADAYSSTLREWTRDRAPLQWALGSANLGNALWALGEARQDASLLRDAGERIVAAMDVFHELGESQYEKTALDNLKALTESVNRLATRLAAAG